ncbi:bifunctional DNA primase/polymerase [Longispora sp. NPDC051575]|uniref:bifunctional DNA primase/polymerase n=1 Tax=Longispora sp. NPDC051575 TaxID=3154943 RepID=UPI0034129996
MSDRQTWPDRTTGARPPAPGPGGGPGRRPGPTLAEAAEEYAAAGFPVLPLHTPTGHGCSCRRPDCSSPGKHPRLPRGLHQASTDPAQVRAWWRRWPDANIGLRTGTLADVCDIDRPGQFTVVLGLLAGHPLGPVVRTGSGGWHLWWAGTGRGNRVRLLDGVDWRGVGGYVVAPPSRHSSGHLYEWLRPLELPLPPCPPRLLRLASSPRRNPAQSSPTGPDSSAPGGSTLARPAPGTSATGTSEPAASRAGTSGPAASGPAASGPAASGQGTSGQGTSGPPPMAVEDPNGPPQDPRGDPPRSADTAPGTSRTPQAPGVWRTGGTRRVPRPRDPEATAWVRAAVEGEASRVAAAQPGERNDTLNVAAFRLGQLVGADLLDAHTVRTALTTAARQCGLGSHETARTIHSGLTAGQLHPRGPTAA